MAAVTPNRWNIALEIQTQIRAISKASDFHNDVVAQQVAIGLLDFERVNESPAFEILLADSAPAPAIQGGYEPHETVIERLNFAVVGWIRHQSGTEELALEQKIEELGQDIIHAIHKTDFTLNGLVYEALWQTTIPAHGAVDQGVDWSRGVLVEFAATFEHSFDAF